MAIDVELKTNKQSNTTWPSTFKASNRFPIVANRVFATLEKAQQYVDDTAADASAYVGIVLAVVQDETAKNNGVYYVSSVAMAEGEKGTLVKVGGTETETAEDYAKAVELSKTLVVGQLIKVEKEYTANAGEENEVKYQKGFYIVEGSGVISALATSTGSEDEVGALKSRVDAVEVLVGDDESGLVKDVKENADAIASNYELISANTEAISALESAYADADAELKSELEGKIDAKVAQTEYDAKVSEIEGKIDEKVAKSDYDTKVAELNSAIDAKVAQTEYDAKVSELNSAIDAKVAQTEYDAKVSEIEGKIDEKFAIADYKAIEKIKVNGSDLVIAESDKSVDITIPSAPVQGVAADEKIISLDGDKLKSNLTIAYVAASVGEDGSHIPSQLRLQGINNEVISSINADKFVKDGMIEKVELDGPNADLNETGKKYLVITWNTEAGKEVMRLDVSELFNPYTASDGVELSDGNFSLKLATGEQYLSVGTDGLSTTQALWDKVNELDNAVLASAQSAATSAETNAKAYADSLAVNYDASGSSAQALVDAKAYADSLAVNYDASGSSAQALTDAKAYADEVSAQALVDAKAYADETSAQALVDAKAYADETSAQALTDAKAYADDNFVKSENFNEFSQELETKLENIEAGAEVNVIENIKVNGKEVSIEDKLASIDVEAKDIKLGSAITADGSEVYGSGQTISAVLQGIQDSVTVAVSGGLTGVVAGDGVSVSEVVANKQTISVRVSSDEGNLVKVGTDGGVFAAMYYDGDDAE
jgi:hypothetical protein